MLKGESSCGHYHGASEEDSCLRLPVNNRQPRPTSSRLALTRCWFPAGEHRLHLLRSPAGPGLILRSASAACARTRGPTRGHCSLRAIVPATPGHDPPCGGRGTGSAERQGPSRTAPGLPRANLPSPRETATAIRTRAPNNRAAGVVRAGSGADLPAPRSWTTSAPPSALSRDPARKGRPFPASGPQLRSRALCRHSGPAQLHLGCSRLGRHPSRCQENFPGSRRGLRAQGTPPPARQRVPSLGALFSARRRARKPSDSPLL